MGITIGSTALRGRAVGSTKLAGYAVGSDVIYRSTPPLPAARLFDGLYNRPELLFSSTAPLTPLRDNGTDKVALAIDTSQGVNVVGEALTGLGAEEWDGDLRIQDSGAVSSWDGETFTTTEGGVATYPRIRATVAMQAAMTIGSWYLVTVSTNLPVAALVDASGGLPNSAQNYTYLTQHANSSNSPFGIYCDAPVAGDYSLSVTVKEVSGIHGVQTTANDQPSYDWALHALDLPGTTQHLDYPNIALGSDVTLMALMRVTTDAVGTLWGSDGAGYICRYEDGGAGSVTSGAGSPIIAVDGTVLSSPTPDSLHTAVATGAWCIVEARGADMSGSEWRNLRLSGSDNVAGEIMADVAMQAPSIDDRNAARQYLASLVNDLTVEDE